MLNNILKEELLNCLEYDRVNAIFDEQNFSKNTESRLMYLYSVMGITQSFACTDCTFDSSTDEEYNLAKEQLVFMNGKRRERSVEVFV